jgi:hypothetical protein
MKYEKKIPKIKGRVASSFPLFSDYLTTADKFGFIPKFIPEIVSEVSLWESPRSHPQNPDIFTANPGEHQKFLRENLTKGLFLC